MHVYDEQTARHYAAYRPPLHQLILDEALGRMRFQTGLDVGCGTGVSTLALAPYCEEVFGVDNSSAMLNQSQSHPKLTYRLGTAQDLPVESRSVDVVTMAGVLSYLDQQGMIEELGRVCQPQAIVVPYDFKVDSNELLRLVGLPERPDTTDYDHACNLSWSSRMTVFARRTRRIELSMTADQAVHVLLSNTHRYAALAKLHPQALLFENVRERLARSDWSGCVEVQIFYAVHGFHRYEQQLAQ